MSFRILWIAWMLLLVGGCRSMTDPAVADPHSLAGDSRIPKELIRPTFTSGQWKRISVQPYSGLVVIRGTLTPEGVFSAGRITDAYPDNSRNRMALELSRKIRIKPIVVGSHILPSGEVFVVFYEDRKPRIAYVFGRQIETVGPTLGQGYPPQVYTQFY